MVAEKFFFFIQMHNTNFAKAKGKVKFLNVKLINLEKIN